jgi:uroporphyrinogen decarboxylase
MCISGNQDGIHAMVPRNKMTIPAKKWRDTYAVTPGAPFVQTTFGLWMCIEKWYNDGLPRDTDLNEFFMFDPPGKNSLGGLGWCEAAFTPVFDEIVLEDRGDTEIVQDYAGRKVLYFKNRRHGFMPEYVDHPVKDWKTWEENVKWRLKADAPGRFSDFDKKMEAAKNDAANGLMMTQNLIGGYMYLRSLLGPEGALYMFYDAPDLIHDCMKTWFELSDAVIAKHQTQLTLDEIYLAEDICYNHGPLISPDMIREFLSPYYQQLITNAKSRQIDKSRKLYIQIDTDGDCRPVIDLYREIGMDAMTPFEVASGCDVVAIAKQYPDLVLSGGFDKRILAKGRAAIDREVERIFPVMYQRGGYIPTCDHGVPEEVTYQDYLYFHQRCMEFNS